MQFGIEGYGLWLTLTLELNCICLTLARQAALEIAAMQVHENT